MNKSIITILVFINFISCVSVDLRKSYQRPLQEHTIIKGKSEKKIVIIDIIGNIGTQGSSSLLEQNISVVQKVVSRLQLAEYDPLVKGVILRIDSPGGTVVGSEILFDEISKFKKRSGKKIVAYVLNVAASGGYYAAIAADKIISHPSSIVGSVGAIYLYPELTDLSKKVGVTMHVHKSGHLKDMGSVFKKPTKEEKILLDNKVKILGNNFLDQVIKSRKISDKKFIKEIETAQVFIASKAKYIGLIDQLGSLYDAVDDVIALSKSSGASVVSYRRDMVLNDTLYNSITTQLSGGNFLQEKLLKLLTRSGFYYLFL